MSLPEAYSTPESYFADSLRFFEEYQNLYKTSNTSILNHNVLDEINVENILKDDVFKDDFNLESLADKNEFLEKFFVELNRLKVKYEEFKSDDNLEKEVNVPLSLKKKHEIIYSAKEIKEICGNSACNVVVDFGAGLGYLDQLLFDKTDLKVLGIDGNELCYVGAKTRQNKYHTNSLQSVKYIKHTISENSDENIQEYIVNKFGKSNFCITGLHACADLTVDGVNLFLKMADAKALILMPCCYHKMAADATKEGRFRNFPLSESLKGIFEQSNGEKYLGVPFLRLAAQPPSRDENLEDLVFNLLARNTLQLYASKHNAKLKRNKRKAVRTKAVHKNFTEYLENATTGFTLFTEKNALQNKEFSILQFDVEEINSIWRETQKLRLKTAIFILLQRYLQPVIENFILYDRLVFLKENGIKNCHVKKIFNEKVSPRCLALISIK